MGKQVGGKFQSWILKTNLPTIRVSEYNLSLSNLPRNGRSNISFKGKMPPSPFLLTIAIGQGCLQKRKGQKTIYHYHDKFYV